MPLVVHGPATLNAWAIRTWRCWTCWSFSPSSARRRCCPHAGRAGAALWTWTRPPARKTAAMVLREMAEALLARLAAGKDTPANQDAPGLAARMGAAWAPAGAGHAMCWPPSAHRRRTRTAWPCGSGNACRNGRNAPPARRPPPSPSPPAQARARLATLLGAVPNNARPRPITPPPPPPPSSPASPRAARMSCWPRPAPAPAKPSATSRPPASGPSRTRAPVWVSTFTRHLQRQIEAEAARPRPPRHQRSCCARAGKTISAC